MKHASLLLALVLCGCSGEAQVAGAAAHVACVDLRDGERFSYQTKSIKNARVHYPSNTASFEFVDDAGKKRYAHSSMDAYIKCVSKEQLP